MSNGDKWLIASIVLSLVTPHIHLFIILDMVMMCIALFFYYHITPILLWINKFMQPSLKTIFREKIENQRKKYENFIINEMSLRLEDDSQDLLNNNNGFLNQGRYYSEHGKFEIDLDINGSKLSVYSIENTKAFLNSQSFAVALLEYKATADDNVQMFFINSMTIYKDIMVHIFVDYLLKNYTGIISDCVQTDKGFNFYKKMAALKDEYGYDFFIKGPDGYIPVNNPVDMDSTFGYSDAYLGYRYFLRNKV
jgi:hypothetical protein